MPSKDAHSTARPAPPPKEPRGPRIPRAAREAARTEVDAYLLGARKASMEAGVSYRQQADEAGERREQGYRTAIDECRNSLRKYLDLEHAASSASLVLGADPAWSEGVRAAYAEAKQRYAAAIERVLNGDVEPAAAPAE